MRIQHKNLTIRQAEVTDAKQLAAWWNDGAVMAHAGFPNGLGTTEEEVVKGLRNSLLVVEENWVLQKSQSVHTPAVLAILQVQQVAGTAIFSSGAPLDLLAILRFSC